MIAAAGGSPAREQPGFLEQDVDLQQIRHALGLGDDVVGDRFRPVERMHLGRRADDRHLGRRLVRIGSIGVRQQPPAAKLAPEQHDARLLAERRIIRLDARDAQQLADDALVHVGILAQVERGEVEAEGLDRANQPPEPAAPRQRPAPTLGERMGDLDEILAQRAGLGIGLGPDRRAPGGGWPTSAS